MASKDEDCAQMASKYVEREMKKRGFYLVRGVWQGGVVHEGDPEDDAELELFLRNQATERVVVCREPRGSLAAHNVGAGG